MVWQNILDRMTCSAITDLGVTAKRSNDGKLDIRRGEHEHT